MDEKHTIPVEGGSPKKLRQPAGVQEQERFTAPVAAPSTAARILIADDNRMILDFVQVLLERQGYTVLAAESPQEALALVQGTREVDLLVSDVVMPQMSGPELYVRLLETMPRLKVIYMSGYPEKFEALMGTADRPVTLLAKPFTSESLLKYVSLALADAQ